MTSARATIMTLVQCRPLWLWHIWGVIICLTAILAPMASEAARGGAIFTILVVPLWTSVITTSLARDFLARPFSFGLPRHEKTWRRTLFLIGLVVAGVCAFVILITGAGSPETMMMRAWQTLFLCMAMYATGALVVMSAPNTDSFRRSSL